MLDAFCASNAVIEMQKLDYFKEGVTCGSAARHPSELLFDTINVFKFCWGVNKLLSVK